MPLNKIKPLILISSMALIILACRLSSSPPSPTVPPTHVLVPTPTIKVILPEKMDFPSPNGRELGDANAPVMVEVFADFQCPACRQFSISVEPQIIQQYVATGKAHLIYRHYPILGTESLEAARASMCASEQNLFWEYHDILFANWNGENQGAYNQDKLLAFAQTIGLDMPAFSACVDAKSYQSVVDQDLQLGTNKGVNGVPTVFVNGKVVTPGYIPGVKDMQKAIDEVLGQP